MYNDKKGYTEILRALDENGARSRTGKPFSKESLCDMLSNQKYKGTYVYKSEEEMVIIPHGIPAIIDEKTFDEAQKRKEANKKGTRSRREKETYLLTGLIVCGECGHAFTGNRRFAGRNKTKYVTYRCTNHNKGEKCM